MYRSSMALLVLVLWVPLVMAQQTKDEPTDPPAQQADEASPEAQLQALQDEFKSARAKFNVEYRKASTDEARSQIMQALYPRPEKFADRFLKLAADHPRDSVAVDALVWILSNVRTGDAIGQATEILAEHHLENERLGEVAQTLVYSQSPGTENFLRRLLDESPHENVRGQACYALAKYLKRRVAMVRQLATRPEFAPYIEQQYGKEFMEQFANGDVAPLEQEVEALFQNVVDEFGEVASRRGGTLGDVAQNDLFEIQHLAIGKIAPDIEGEDIDEVHFQLSDYRGKVVVLDFWGNW